MYITIDSESFLDFKNHEKHEMCVNKNEVILKIRLTDIPQRAFPDLKGEMTQDTERPLFRSR